MKAVEALVHDDKVALRWREGWDRTDWLPDAGDLTKGWEYHGAIDEDLELRMRVMDYGFSQTPLLRDSISDPTGNPDSPRMMPLTNERFISVLVNNVRELLTEWDWILTEVARITGDDSLHQFTSIGHALDAKWRTEDVQKAKKTAANIKRGENLKEKLPTDAQITHAFNETVKAWGGREVRGDTDSRERFFKDIIRRVDEKRREEGQIKMEESWGVSVGRVINLCSKLNLLK